jgi:hypothetical protein
MSANETTQPAPRVLIGPATEPNPPWTGLYFTCEVCGGQYQLGCADECDPVDLRAYKTQPPLDADLWLAPECWTCGHRNVIKTPRCEREREVS